MILVYLLYVDFIKYFYNGGEIYVWFSVFISVIFFCICFVWNLMVECVLFVWKWVDQLLWIFQL